MLGYTRKQYILKPVFYEIHDYYISLPDINNY